VVPSHLSLFTMPNVEDITGHLLDQDVIWVLGGSVCFLPYSNGVHYDTNEGRRPLFQSLIAAAELPEGYATDDGVGLLYRGDAFIEAVAELDGRGAYHVVRGNDGSAVESRVDVRRL
jgi:hypothetical protein